MIVVRGSLCLSCCSTLRSIAVVAAATIASLPLHSTLKSCCQATRPFLPTVSPRAKAPTRPLHAAAKCCEVTPLRPIPRALTYYAASGVIQPCLQPPKPACCLHLLGLCSWCFSPIRRLHQATCKLHLSGSISFFILYFFIYFFFAGGVLAAGAFRFCRWFAGVKSVLVC